uniref:Replicative DNA helicase n=1 Tax=Sciadococcus taiwanensis TaxID=3028030 RepID=A0A9Y1MX88_9RHOD|nr:replication helicase subunit [Sciadococcus taiwanensis]
MSMDLLMQDNKKIISLQPYNLLAEEMILGSILIDSQAITRIAMTLRPEAFYSLTHQLIYKMALQLQEKGYMLDLTTISNYLADYQMLEKIGGLNKLTELTTKVISTINLDQYIAIVNEKYLRRLLIEAGNQLSSLAYNTQIPLEEIFDISEQKLLYITQKSLSENIIHTSNILVETFSELGKKSQSDNFPGLKTNFYELDTITQGLQNSDFIIIAGRPSMGKTALSLNIARNIAISYNLPVLIFSLEMSRQQLIYRLLSSESHISTSKLRSGKISTEDWTQLNNAIDKLSKSEIYIDDTPNLSILNIRSKSRKLIIDKGKIGIILIDYLQLMNDAEKNHNRVQELSKITRGLKSLSRELNIPIIVLSQLSRSVESRINKRPMLSDLRESGSIEQDADVVIMLYRDEYYEANTNEPNIAELIVAKQRSGPIGTVKLLFNSKLTQFSNL